MAHDFIGDTFLTLAQQNRVREAKEFCERVITEAPDPIFRCMAQKNLAELYFHFIGDGAGVRTACLAALAELDANPEMIENPKHASSKAVQGLYRDLCALMRDVAITFDEYKEYQTKKWKYHPSREEEQRTEQVEKTYSVDGVPWIENIMSHAGDYWQHNAFSQAAVYLSLALEYKKELKLGREDLNVHTLVFYPGAIINIISGNVNACLDRGEDVRVDNYAFIAENAIARIDACRESRIADVSVIDTAVQTLTDFLSELRENRKREEANGYNGRIPSPTQEEIALRFGKEMEDLKDAYLHIDASDSLSETGAVDAMSPVPKIGPPRGCLLPVFIVLLAIAGYYWYSALITKEHGTLAWVLAIICSLLWLPSLVAIIKTIVGRKK